MKTSPLHPDFGLVVHDVDLRAVTETHLFPAIRQAFETHSALLFPAQQMDDDTHLRLARLFGPLENRDAMAAGRDMAFEIPKVSNETDTGVTGALDLHTLNLQANMLWHTDSTFLPVPALAMGGGAGGDPVGFLWHQPLGWACAAAGVALLVAGLAWIEAMLFSSATRATCSV